jgi:triosephosphate isomerase (TIM)
MAYSPVARKKMVIGNWKLHPKTKNQAINLALDILKLRPNVNKLDICIIPPQLFISAICSELDFEQTNISVGSQNCHYELDGAFTGEVSAASLKDIGVKYVLCGHSERRTLFNETDHIINRKVRKIVEVGMTPILCIGESLEEKKLDLVAEVCNTQLKNGLNGILDVDAEEVVIAYEPVWAIGTGKVCSAVEAEKTIKQIRQTLVSMYGDVSGQRIRIIYGGSVNENNINDLMDKKIDGVLVGGASINAETFGKILNY